jgi:hypothetical protein
MFLSRQNSRHTSRRGHVTSCVLRSARKPQTGTMILWTLVFTANALLPQINCGARVCSLSNWTTVDISACACGAVNALNRHFYDPATFAWVKSCWWTANGVETLANYIAARLPDAANVPEIVENTTDYYAWKKLEDNDYYDDKLWW